MRNFLRPHRRDWTAGGEKNVNLKPVPAGLETDEVRDVPRLLGVTTPAGLGTGHKSPAALLNAGQGRSPAIERGW